MPPLEYLRAAEKEGEMGGMVHGGMGQGGQGQGQGQGKDMTALPRSMMKMMGSPEVSRGEDNHHSHKDQDKGEDRKNNNNNNHHHNNHHDHQGNNYNHNDNLLNINNQWDRRLQAFSANSHTPHNATAARRRVHGLGGNIGNHNADGQSSLSRSSMRSSNAISLKSSLRSAKMSSISGRF